MEFLQVRTKNDQKNINFSELNLDQKNKKKKSSKKAQIFELSKKKKLKIKLEIWKLQQKMLLFYKNFDKLKTFFWEFFQKEFSAILASWLEFEIWKQLSKQKTPVFFQFLIAVSFQTRFTHCFLTTLWHTNFHRGLFFSNTSGTLKLKEKLNSEKICTKKKKRTFEVGFYKRLSFFSLSMIKKQLCSCWKRKHVVLLFLTWEIAVVQVRSKVELFSKRK